MALDAIGVGILQLPFLIAIVILGPIAGIIAAKYGATKLLIPSALTILLSFILLTFLHSTPEQVGINLIFLVPVIVNGEEKLFPSVVAFNLMFFICMILGIVLTIAVVLMRSKVIKVTSASTPTALK